MITIIGAGLAGCEAAYLIAERGIPVTLYEMRPKVSTEAHHTGGFAELVCSNSLKAERLETASGLLKEEMKTIGSLILEMAYLTRVEAGGALAVDRNTFSEAITDKIKNHPLITVIEEEVKDLSSIEGIVIVATGPLTSPALFDYIKSTTGEDNLYFYDAAAPIVMKESIDFDSAFMASRYDRGDADYINCPMTREEYTAFYEALTTAESAPLKHFEDAKVFEGCMPVEKMASRGFMTLCFGPLKPKGLKDPKTGKEPFACVQLRKDNSEGTLYNIVGFQTNLKWGEQKRVFSMIPALKNAEFVRYGVMHRNTFLNRIRLLKATMQLENQPNVFFAGQITGMEGYMESAMGGLLAGLNAARLYENKAPLVFPRETLIGALSQYVTDGQKHELQPMNSNYGLLPPLQQKVKDKNEARKQVSLRSLEILKTFLEENGEGN